MTHNDRYVALKYGECLESSGRLQDAKKMVEIAVEKLPIIRKSGKASQDALKTVVRKLEKQRAPEVVPGEAESKRQRIGLISCTESKKSYTCTAREL